VGGLPLVPHLALRAVHKDDLRGHTHAAAGGTSEGEEDRDVVPCVKRREWRHEK
jgi:hypothetical protein